MAVGCPYHIAQRSNFRCDVFFGEENRVTCLDLLAQFSADVHLQIPGFCLMSNHTHLLAVPSQQDSMAIAMRDTRQAYSRWLNIRLRQTTRTGRPFGAPDFVAELEAKLDRTLHPRKRGRKPKTEQEPERSHRKAAGKG